MPSTVATAAGVTPRATSGRSSFRRRGALGLAATAFAALLLAGCGGSGRAPAAAVPAQQAPVTVTSSPAAPADDASLASVDASLDSVDQTLNQIDANLADADQSRATSDDG